MFTIYSHTGGSHSNATIVDTLDNAEAFVCPTDHPDRAIFDSVDKGYAFPTIDAAFEALVLEKVDFVAASEAWQRAAGKNKNGGLNAKGRASYNRAHGGHLKAPSKDKKNKRRKSFCARMKGMKKRLTSSKTANDPDSRINKALRAWDC